MISNHCTYNTNPLAAMLCYDRGFALARPIQSRKRSLAFSRPIKCSSSEEPASKKRRMSPIITTPATPVKKSVRFAEEANTVVYRMVSTEDLRASWYNPREIATFKQDSKRSVYELYKVGGDFSQVSDDHCIRGLEHVVTPLAAMAQKKARKDRVAAVLMQQQLQRETSTSNPELLKLISTLCSKPRCDDAVRMGVLDSQIWAEYF